MAGKRGGKRYGTKKERTILLKKTKEKKIESELGLFDSNLEKKMMRTRNRKEIVLAMMNGDDHDDDELEEGEPILEIYVREEKHNTIYNEFNKIYREFPVFIGEDRIKLALSSSTKYLKNWWFITTKRLRENQNSAIVLDLLFSTDVETLWIFAHLDRVLIFKSIPGVTIFPSLMKRFFKGNERPTLLRFSADNTQLLQTLWRYNLLRVPIFNLSELLWVPDYISLDRAIQAFWGITVNGGLEIHDFEWVDFDIDEIVLENIGVAAVAAVNGYFLGQMFPCIAKEIKNDD